MATKQDMTDQDPGAEEGLAPERGKTGVAGEGEGGPRRLWEFPAMIYGSLLRKPVVLAAAALLIGALAAWAALEIPAWKGGNDARSALPPGAAAQEDNLRQEELSRFYIPLPKDCPDLVMVVDLTVAWDALSAIRFRRAEVSIRDRVYESLSSLALKDAGVRGNTTALEEAISGIFREMLHAEALSVKVKDVQVF